MNNSRTFHVLVATPAGTTGQGGIDRVMASLKAQLELEGNNDVEVTFGTTRGSGHVALSAYHTAAFLAQLIALRLAGRVDLVHINLASEGSTLRKLMIARTARALGVPYVLHLHGADYREYWTDERPNLSRRIKAMFENAAQIVVLGKVWRDFVAERAPNAASRITIIPNSSARSPLPHTGGGDTVHILFLGRIGNRKGVPQLGEALRRMLPIPGWRATIAGDGHVDIARQRSAEYGLEERLDIPGWVGPERVAELIAGADILALPSFSENLPVSVIEAMGAGLAVVTTPVGAVEDIVEDGVTGLLVPPGDVDALTEALTRLVGDKALRDRLGAAALAYHKDNLDLEHFSASMRQVWSAAAR